MNKISGFWIDNYVEKMNAHCPATELLKVKWTVDDLQPGKIRKYCKRDSTGVTGICWSCKDYLSKYMVDLEKYELNVNVVKDMLAEIIEKQHEMDIKLDIILSALKEKKIIS